MIRLFALFSLSYWVRRPLKALLTILGVATGLAVFTGIETANRSILKGIETTIRRASGFSDLAIESRSRTLTESDFLEARRIPGTRTTPVLEIPARCAGSEARAFSLLGIDPLSRSDFFAGEGSVRSSEIFVKMMADPAALVLSPDLARACGAREGEFLETTVAGKTARFKVMILPEGDNPWAQGSFAFADIATAQEKSGRVGELTRLEVRSRNQDAAEWIAAHRGRFPAGLGFIPQPERLRFQKEILRAFQLNLRALSLVAVFVSGFIVFNAASLSLLYRRKDLGILRSLGATRGQLAALFVVEALLLAAVGTALAWVLGYYLAGAVLQPLLGTVRDLYVAQAAARPEFDRTTAFTGLWLAAATCLLGTLVPLFEASRIAPIEATRRLGYEKRFRHRRWIWVAASGLAFAAAALFVRLNGIAHPAYSFAAAFAVLSGFLLLTPLALAATVSVFHAAAVQRRLASVQIAASQIRENPYRYGVVTAAFSLGMALWIGVGIMIHSFRHTVHDWLGATIRGDIYLTLTENRRGQWAAFMPETFRETVQAFPEVVRMDTLRGIPAYLGEENLPLSAVALHDLLKNGQFQIYSGSAAAFFQNPSGEDGAMPAALAESLARRHRLKVGDTFAVATPWGDWKLRVGLVLYDYTSERGLIYVDREDFLRRVPDPRVNGIALYLKNPQDAAELARRIRALPSAPPSLLTQLNRELKARVMDIFDQTFRLTEAMKYVALLVAFLGILTTLATLLEEKRREIGLLQVMGMLPGQLTAYGLAQGLLLAATGYLLGGGAGLALAWVLLKVVHFGHFGWTLFYYWDPALLALSFGLTGLTGALAALWPIRLLRKIRPSEALRYEE